MKFPLWASVLTLAGAALLLKLGFWQLDRMAWKADLLARLDAAYAVPPGPFLDEARGISDLAPFARGFIEGEYLALPSILVGPQMREKQPGFHVYAALQAGDKALFINRGWVPLAYKGRGGAAAQAPKGRWRVSGLVRQPERAVLFVAGNEPARGLWRRADPYAFADALGLGRTKVSPLILYAEAEEALSGVSAEPLPVYFPAALPVLSNNHFQYALFWFAMCGLLIFFYLLRFHNIPVRKP